MSERRPPNNSSTWPNCDRLVLHIEIDQFNADGIREGVEGWLDDDEDFGEALLETINEEIMATEIGVVFKPRDTESEMPLIARTCRVVGAEIRSKDDDA